MSKKDQSRTAAKKKAMLYALEQHLGVVTEAAKLAGIDRATHYGWLKTDEEYKVAVESLEDLAIDFAESQLHRQIKEGDTTATIFFLKTKGRKRGYNERDQFTAKVTRDSVELQIDLDN